VSAGRKAGRIDGEIGFDSAKRKGALFDRLMQDRCVSRVRLQSLKNELQGDLMRCKSAVGENALQSPRGVSLAMQSISGPLDFTFAGESLFQFGLARKKREG
jgi:hypothetical protein